MENHQDGNHQELESGESGAISQNLVVSRPNRRTEIRRRIIELQGQVMYQRSWIIFARSSNLLPRTRASTSAAYRLYNVPRRMRQNGFRTFFNPFHTISSGVNSASSNSSGGSNIPSLPAPNGQPSGVEGEDRVPGLCMYDITANTRIIMNWVGNEDDEQLCVICLNVTRKFELLRILPCWHIFHKECIDNWLRLKGICPMCRRDIRSR